MAGVQYVGVCAVVASPFFNFLNSPALLSRISVFSFRG